MCIGLDRDDRRTLNVDEHIQFGHAGRTLMDPSLCIWMWATLSGRSVRRYHYVRQVGINLDRMRQPN